MTVALTSTIVGPIHFLIRIVVALLQTPFCWTISSAFACEFHLFLLPPSLVSWRRISWLHPVTPRDPPGQGDLLSPPFRSPQVAADMENTGPTETKKNCHLMSWWFEPIPKRFNLQSSQVCLKNNQAAFQWPIFEHW